MKNLSLKAKLLLIGGIPMLAFVIVYSHEIYLEVDTFNNANTTEHEIEALEASSLAVHELQKERGQSANYLSGAAVLNKLIAQHSLSDKKIIDFKKIIPVSDFKKAYRDQLYKILEEIEPIRKGVKAKTIGTSEAVNKYSGVITQLLNMAAVIRKETKLAMVSSELSGLSALEDAKEHGGKLRFVVSGVLAKNKPISGDKVKEILNLQAGLIANIKSKALILNGEEERFLTGIFESKGWRAVMDTVLTVIEKRDQGNYYRDSQTFFTLITGELNKLNQAIADKRTKIKEASIKIRDEARYILIRDSILMVILISVLFINQLYSIKKLSTQLREISTSLSNGSSSLSTAASQLSKTSQTLSQSTVEQASGLQETVSSADEISAMVAKNASSAKSSSKVSANSQKAAKLAQDSVSRMLKAIGEIKSSNEIMVVQLDTSNNEISEIVKVIKEIGDKTNVINDIVFQTKLLSFNASVEAARAGEHGKGFAVVAEEVGNLASMSGNAANEISAMLNESTKKVEKIVDGTKEKVLELSTSSVQKVDLGMKTAEEVNQSLGEIMDSVSKVDQMVKEISDASNEQSIGVQEITKAMSELDKVTQSNSHQSQSASEVAEQIQGQAVSVDSIVKNLFHLIDGNTGVAEQKVEERYSSGSHRIEETANNVIEFKERPQVVSEDVKVKKAAGSDFQPDWDDPGFEEV